MTDFNRNFLQRSADERQGRDVMCMPVTLDDLRGSRRRFQVQLAHDFLFDVRREVSKCTYRAGKLSHAHGFHCFFEPVLVPFYFIVQKCQFQPKCGGFGMNTMRPSHNNCRLEFVSASFEYVEQMLQAFRNENRGIGNLKSHRRVEYIGGGKSEVKVP